jgi:hypothetical protein
MPIPSFKLKMLSNGKLLMVGGKLSTNLDCCCEGTCPCCYSTFQILRGTKSPISVRNNVLECFGGSTTTGDLYSFLCDDETYSFGVENPVTSSESCVCLREVTITTSYYGESLPLPDHDSPCYQQYQTTDEDVCNFNPPGPGVGVETHYGAFNFREVIDLSLCYDPCGTIDVTIRHRVYARWGVIRDSQPPPIAGSPVQDFYETDADELIFDAKWEWIGVTCPNCEELPDLGAPTSYTPAADFTKTWGAPFINSTYCGTPSSFTITIPGSCAATGLILYGANGTPCDCG